MSSRFYRYHSLNQFHTKLIDDDPLDLKYHKVKQERLSHLYKNRFKSVQYAKQVREVEYTPQVVFKIVSKGVGKQALNYLMQYISRDLDKFSISERVELTNSIGEAFKGKPQIRRLCNEMSLDFDSVEYIKDKKNSFDEAEGRRLELEAEKFDRNLSAREEIELQQINQDMITYKANLKLKELNYKSRNRELSKEEIKEKNNLQSFITKNSEKRKSGLEKIPHHRMPNDFTHIILSHGGDNINPKRAKASVDSFLRSEFGDRGFDYVYGMHNDTEHPHFHVIVFNKNKLHRNKPPFQLSKQDLFFIRQELVHHSDKHGIKRISTLKVDNKLYMKQMQQSINNATDKLSQYQYKLQKGSTENFDAFDYRKKVLAQLDSLNDRLTRKYRTASPDLQLLINRDKKKIREIKKEFLKTDDDKFINQLSMVCNSLYCDHKQLSKAVHNYIKKPVVKKIVKSSKSLKRKRSNVEKLEQDYKKRIYQALEECELHLKKNKCNQGRKRVKAHIDLLLGLNGKHKEQKQSKSIAIKISVADDS